MMVYAVVPLLVYVKPLHPFVVWGATCHFYVQIFTRLQGSNRYGE